MLSSGCDIPGQAAEAQVAVLQAQLGADAGVDDRPQLSGLMDRLLSNMRA